ncbi:hypothetical protein D9611_008082 [Ephemerocybe angulata]|uniref:Uncharacterized protein n=1 Tax=Ephemerocybe angulata TaxID=980116 RepID=A0A8H5BZS2_9AGAR|nr:hypothetical protein D9611_008082 [Tulosesus angulatus]
MTMSALPVQRTLRPPATMKQRHRVFAILTAAFFCYLLSHTSTTQVELNEEEDLTEGIADRLSPVHEHQFPAEIVDSNSTLCQYNECLQGRWVPREPQFKTLEDFQEVFAKKGSTKWSSCNVGEPPSGVTRTPAETKSLKEQRIVDIMNWMWQPSDGEWIPWDPMDFVVRLLKTPGGLVFMGDSLSQGHEHAFGSYLQEGGIKFTMDPPHLPKDSFIRTHILQKHHPMTLELQKRAGVPDSRLDYPIFSVVEEHMLVHEEELRYLTGLNGATEGWPWHLRSMKRADDWEAFFRWLTKGRPGEDASVTRDTILVLNTGAHWSRGTLYMLPRLETLEQERAALTNVYKTMVKMVMKKFSQYTRLTIFYRSTNPGHPSCQLHTKPFADLSEARLEEARFFELSDLSATSERDIVTRRRWDWDYFNVHSQIWREEISRLERLSRMVKQPNKSRFVRGVKWLFMDVYDMSLQRPDAHSSPGKDCLHSVYFEWSRHLYHLLYLEQGS